MVLHGSMPAKAQPWKTAADQHKGASVHHLVPILGMGIFLVTSLSVKFGTDFLSCPGPVHSILVESRHFILLAVGLEMMSGGITDGCI